MLDILLLMIVLVLVTMMALGRSIKIEIKHLHEIINRTTYEDVSTKAYEETPPPYSEKAEKEMEEYYEKKKDPMEIIWGLVHDMEEEPNGKQ